MVRLQEREGGLGQLATTLSSPPQLFSQPET
jgi:hypothetical protein